MAHFYTDESRETETYSLPDAEVFAANYATCEKCSSIVFFDHYTADDGRLVADCQDCHTTNELDTRGWFYWCCLPGCLPDSDPFGPFDTEEAAIEDARENAND